MNILVTGGAGFIGSSLCNALVNEKVHNIASLDNYSTGFESNHIQQVNYIKGSTCDVSSLIKFKPDIVFHFGEFSRVEQSVMEPDKVWEANIRGTYEIVKFCSHHGAKLIYAGSSTKFGDGGLGRSQTPYGWSKACNTEYISNYAQWFGLKHAIVYFYNVYGPREISQGDYATLIGIFTNKMLNNQPLTVVSPGTQRRNFTHVEDIVNGLLLVAAHGSGDDFGIGASESYSIIEVAQLFGGEIRMLPPRMGNRFNAELRTDKIYDLGWRPKHNLKSYIEKLKSNSWRATSNEIR